MAEKVTSKLKGNMWRLIILAIAGSLIYGLPYFRTYYYDAYLEAYNLTNTQMGALGSMFGIFGMISYLFGGVVADFISPKKLISISLILTGVALYRSVRLLARPAQGHPQSGRPGGTGQGVRLHGGRARCDQRGPSGGGPGHHHRRHQQAGQRLRP